MLGLLSVFNCENSLPRGDIVFVHGVAGHPWGTWHPPVSYTHLTLPTNDLV